MPFRFSDVQAAAGPMRRPESTNYGNLFMQAAAMRQRQALAKMQDDRMRAQQEQDAHQFGQSYARLRDNDSQRAKEWEQAFAQQSEQMQHERARQAEEDAETRRKGAVDHELLRNQAYNEGNEALFRALATQQLSPRGALGSQLTQPGAMPAPQQPPPQPPPAPVPQMEPPPYMLPGRRLF